MADVTVSNSSLVAHTKLGEAFVRWYNSVNGIGAGVRCEGTVGTNSVLFSFFSGEYEVTLPAHDGVALFDWTILCGCPKVVMHLSKDLPRINRYEVKSDANSVLGLATCLSADGFLKLHCASVFES